MFKDRVYEEMDDISKLVEPYQYSLNEALAQFPDQIELTTEELSSPWGINCMEIFRSHVNKLELNHLLKSHRPGDDFFQFKIIDEFGEYVDTADLNFRDSTLSNKIVMVKSKIGYEDFDVEKIAKQAIIEGLQVYNSYRMLNASRLNEIADLFNDNATKKERSVRRKMPMFRKHMGDLIDSKKLDIRDVGLCTRFASWIIAYVQHGNLAALNNITRLKIMTHQNRPIYSIEEKDIK
jgi:hypothetical protein